MKTQQKNTFSFAGKVALFFSARLLLLFSFVLIQSCKKNAVEQTDFAQRSAVQRFDRTLQTSKQEVAVLFDQAAPGNIVNASSLIRETVAQEKLLPLLNVSKQLLQAYGLLEGFTETFTNVNDSRMILSGLIIFTAAKFDMQKTQTALVNKLFVTANAYQVDWFMQTLKCLGEAIGVGKLLETFKSGILSAIKTLGITGVIKTVGTAIAEVMPWFGVAIGIWTFTNCMIEATASCPARNQTTIV